MLPGYTVHRDFFPDAEALRARFEDHFARPHQHRAETHQIWNYWSVPEMYTYLRTLPDRLFGPELTKGFMEHLRRFARETYGFTRVGNPYVSLYVAGCRQGLHNDAENGRMGYVYSITRWEGRRFEGGETIVIPDTAYFGTARSVRAGAGRSLYAQIPAEFNQLLVFDDRLPHAVQRIEGTMEPTAGRVVVHGHLSEGGLHVEGALGPHQIEAAMAGAIEKLALCVRKVGDGLAGAVNLRLTVAPDGAVTSVKTLYDRLLPMSPAATDPAEAVAALEGFFAGLRFPAAAGDSRVTIPVPIGPRLK